MSKDRTIKDHYDQHPELPRRIFDELRARGWEVECIYGPAYMISRRGFVRGIDGVTTRMSDTIEIATGRRMNHTGKFVPTDVDAMLAEIDSIPSYSIA